MLICIGYFDFLKKYLNSSNVLKRPQRFSFQIPKPGHFSSSLAGHNVPRKASHSHNSATGKMQSAIRNFLVKITDFLLQFYFLFLEAKQNNRSAPYLQKKWKTTCFSIYTNSCFLVRRWMTPSCDQGLITPDATILLGLIGWFRCGINLVIITN